WRKPEEAGRPRTGAHLDPGVRARHDVELAPDRAARSVPQRRVPASGLDRSVTAAATGEAHGGVPHLARATDEEEPPAGGGSVRIDHLDLETPRALEPQHAEIDGVVRAELDVHEDGNARRGGVRCDSVASGW